MLLNLKGNTQLWNQQGQAALRPGVNFITCFRPYAKLFALRAKLSRHKKASQKLGARRKLVYEINPWMQSRVKTLCCHAPPKYYCWGE